MNAADSRAHDSWLAAKQAERRLEEARSEASILRKKLTNILSSTENNFSNSKYEPANFIKNIRTKKLKLITILLTIIDEIFFLFRCVINSKHNNNHLKIIVSY